MATVGTTAGVAGNVNEAMKVIFEEPMTDNINTDSEMLDIFEQDMNVSVNETTGGRYIELAHYFHLPAGVGARRLEGDYIPVPQGPTIKNSQVYLKKIEGVVEMSGDAMRRVQKGEGAFLDWADRAMPDLVRRVTNEMDRMLIGYGAGVKARVAGTYTLGSTTIPVDRSFGVTGYTGAFLQFLENETVIANSAITGDGATQRAGVAKVTDVDPAGNIVVDVAPTGLAVGDYIFAGDAAANSSRGGAEDREIMGLLGMVDDGAILSSFQGLTRSQYRPWNSIAVDASVAPYSGAMSEDLLVYADDTAFVLGGAAITDLVMNRLAARKYWAGLKADRVINDPRSFTGGKGTLNVLLGTKLLALRVVRKLPAEVAFGLDRTTFKRWQNTGWEWDDTTGSIWNRVTDGTGRKDSFYAVGHMVLQTGCVAPRKNLVIRNLSST